jgi:peptidyl-prolyl cis-trans isomerase SurA
MPATKTLVGPPVRGRRGGVAGIVASRPLLLAACLMIPFFAQQAAAQRAPAATAASSIPGEAARRTPGATAPNAPGATAPNAPGATSPHTAVLGTPLPGTRIIAVVNGDVITSGDVENRARLFALSSGLSTSSDVIERLKTQIGNQLVDEKLRLQEAQRRKVVVPDKQIASAIHDIEQRNNMPEGALRQKLSALGVSVRTLIDQIRIQLAWTQVLREHLADKINITDAEVDEQMRLHDRQVGKPEFRVGEIFIPVDDPSNTADARRFAETVIGELRAGAAFAAVAAQFSQTQSALEGGELGWVQPDQLDPQVALLVTQMPVGAVSNPVKVPGGFSIVTVQGKREIGRDIATFISLRQVFLSFTEPLDPQHPTDQQRLTLEKARGLTTSIKSCPQMEQFAKTNPSARPPDPGEVRLDTVNPPPFRELLTTLPAGQASQPLVAGDGIAVIIICSKEQKNSATLTKDDVRRRLITDRVEMASRQLMRDLRRKATIQRVDKGT